MTNSGAPRTAIVFAGFIAVGVVIAAVFAPNLIDLRALSPRITAELSRAVGQSVDVRGDILLSIVPRPQLILRDLATKPFDGTKLAFAVGEARADLSWRDLVLGEYTIDKLKFVRPAIDVALSGLPIEAVAVPEITLDRAQVRLHQGQTIRMIDALDANVLLTAAGVYTWDVSARFEGQSVSGNGKLGPPSKSNARNAQINLMFPEADVALNYLGTISSDTAKGRSTLTARRAADAATLFGIGPANLQASAWSAQTFGFATDVEYAENKINLANGEVTLADQAARVSGVIDISDRRTFSLKTQLTQIDPVFWWSMTTGSENVTTEAATQKSNTLLDLFAGTGDWIGDIKLEATSFGADDQAIRDLSIDLGLKNEVWALRDAALTLPGQARISAAGLWNSDDESGFSGTWRVDALDAQRTLHWLGVDRSTEPSPAPFGVAASGAIQTNSKLTVLSDVALSFGSSQAKGRLAFGQNRTTPFVIDLDIDRLALDQYLPILSAILKFRTEQTPPEVQPSPGYGLTPSFPWLSALAPVRGTLRLAIPELTWRDTLIGTLGVDVAVGDGALDVRSVAFEDKSAGAIWFGGKIKDLSAVPTFENVQFELKVTDAARLARASRADIPRLASALMPWALTGAINGPVIDANVAMTGKLGPISMKASGRGGLVDQNTKLELTFEAAHPNATQLRDLASGGAKFATKLEGPVIASSKLKLDRAKLAVSDIAILIGRNRLAGQLEIDNAAKPRSINATFTNIDFDTTAFSADTVLPLPIPGRWSGDVTLSGSRFKSLHIDTSAFSARFVASPGVIELAEWKGNLYGGPAQVGLKWAKVSDPSAPQPSHELQGQIVISGADAALMFDGLAVPNKTKADLVFSFSAKAAKPIMWLGALSGAGNAKLTLPANAPTKSTGVLAPLAAVARAESPNGQVSSKIETTTSFSLERGVATLKDLTIQSNAYKGQLEGAVDLNQKIFDLKGSLKLRDRGMIVGSAAQLVLPPTVPLTIAGPMDAPTIKLDVSGNQR